MTTASELITEALATINVPGRGANLGSGHLTGGLKSLQQLINSKAVSKRFTPGIRTHFFAMTSGQSVFTYGASPQCDFRSDDFDDDPAPIKIEDAYIRQGGSITNNEQVDEYRFENVGTWVEAGTAVIENNELVMDGIGSVSQSLGLVSGTTYTMRFYVDIAAGDVLVDILANAVSVYDITVDSSGTYEVDFVFTGTVPSVAITTDTGTDSLVFTYFSIIERTKERLVLATGGSDYGLRPWDQKGYNGQFSKGNSGRPARYLFSRDYPFHKIKFDQSAIAGDILVMDVLVNRLVVTDLDAELKINDDQELWLTYKLASLLCPKYGKKFSADQREIMRDAYRNMTAGNRRINNLRVDSGLRQRTNYNINRGD